MYQRLVQGTDPIESRLLSSLPEHLNSEIVAGTVRDGGEAVQWLRYSYLFCRVRKNPVAYGAPLRLPAHQLDGQLKAFVLATCGELSAAGLARQDEDGFGIAPTDVGRAACRYYVRFNTMKSLRSVPAGASMLDILQTLVAAEEFDHIVLRRDEKVALRALNATVAHPLRSEGSSKAITSVATSLQKRCLLVQDALADCPSADYRKSGSDAVDTAELLRNGVRIAHCSARARPLRAPQGFRVSHPTSLRP